MEGMSQRMCDCNQGRLPCTCRPVEQMVSVPREHLERLVSHAEDEIEHAGTDLQAVVASVRQSMAQQHQGEPVAWRYSLDESVTYSGTRWRECKNPFTETPLYTHADPAEVKRLRDKFKCDYQDFKREREKWWTERDTLRSQLAEAHALLREVRVGCYSRHMAKIDAHLSASAEPSAPAQHTLLSCSFCDATDTEGNPWVGSNSIVDGKLVYRVWGCKDHGHLARVVQKAMQPSAPVEIDERAEFEKCFGNCTWDEGDFADEQRGWQARAALERKS